jgi:hypothetical protein
VVQPDGRSPDWPVCARAFQVWHPTLRLAGIRADLAAEPPRPYVPVRMTVPTARIIETVVPVGTPVREVRTRVFVDAQNRIVAICTIITQDTGAQIWLPVPDEMALAPLAASAPCEGKRQ